MRSDQEGIRFAPVESGFDRARPDAAASGGVDVPIARVYVDSDAVLTERAVAANRERTGGREDAQYAPITLWRCGQDE